MNTIDYVAYVAWGSQRGWKAKGLRGRVGGRIYPRSRCYLFIHLFFVGGQRTEVVNRNPLESHIIMKYLFREYCGVLWCAVGRESRNKNGSAY